MAPVCYARNNSESGRAATIAGQSVAAGWVLGDLKPLGGSRRHVLRTTSPTRTRPVWKELTALPRAEQLSRISAMHTAALSCDGRPARGAGRR